MYHNLTVQETLDKLFTAPKNGLSKEEVKKRQEENGKNKLPEAKRESTFHKIFKQFTDLLVVILIVAAVFSFSLGETLDAAVILFIVVLNGTLSYVQEARAEKAIDALKSMSTEYSKVIRDGETKQIKVEDLVPGDIIILESGDKIPADARLIESSSLKIAEAVLTGESTAIDKITDQIKVSELPIGDRKNMVYKGTSVTYGRGKAVVTAIGQNTEIGNISRMLSTDMHEETPLGKELDIVGKRLTLAAGFIIIVIFFIAYYVKGLDLHETFLTSISLAVAAIPEGLPAVVTITLAIGVSRLAKHKAIVRRLQAVVTLGSTNYILTDKTGTLTQNKMTAVKVATPKDVYDVMISKNGVRTFLNLRGRAITPDEDDRLKLLLLNALLCNDAEFNLKRNGEETELEVLGDPTETALTELVHYARMDINTLYEHYNRIHEIPFSSETKRMIVVTENPTHKEEVNIFAKGAPEVIKNMVNDYTSSIEEVSNIFASEGLRNLAFSFKTLNRKDYEEAFRTNNEDALLKNHKYLGMISQKDPLRPEIKEAMNSAHQAGIKSIMITGDHKLTATSIAKELDLVSKEEEVMDGVELGDTQGDQLIEILKRVKVFARVSPEQKLNIVKAVKQQGFITAVTGDGVNDAPAIKTADIGISMGITGTDVSKEVSDMVLQDDNYATIVDAIEQGRIVYNNLVKFITYLISCNIAEILIVAIAMLMGPVLPLLPIHILWINLVTDGLPALALGMEPGETDVMSKAPREKGHLLTINRWGRILFQSFLITIATFIVFWVGLQESVEVAQTATFSTLAFCELFRALNSRSETHSIFSKKLKPNYSLYITIIVSVFIQILVIYTSIGNSVLGTVPLEGKFLTFSLLLALIPIIGTEFYKLTLKKD